MLRIDGLRCDNGFVGYLRGDGSANSGGFVLGISRIVVLAEHLYVTAQGQAADAVLRFAPLKFDQRPRNFPARKGDSKLKKVKADIKLLAFDSARFGNQKMTQLMHKNHERQASRHAQPGQYLQSQPGRQARLLRRSR